MTIGIDKRIVTLMCGVSALVLPQLSHAQAAAEGNGDDILVTATRDARSLQEVPMQVDVATCYQLENLNTSFSKDISQLAPWLDLNNN